MPEPTVEVVGTHPCWTKDEGVNPRSASMAAEALGAPTQWQPDLTRAPEYYVYLYTVSKLEFTVHRAPLIPSLIIPACKPDERYRLVVRIPHPFSQVEIDPLRGDWLIHDRGAAHDGRRIAQDICYPDNITLNQDAYLRVQNMQGLSYGCNLSQQGVFWSLDNPPKEEDIKAAEHRRHVYYEQIWNQANALSSSDPKALQELLTRDHHMAAEYFGIDVPWHQVPKPMVDCPNCGEKIKQGIAFHRSASLGVICVIGGQEGWKRAVQAGVKSVKEANAAGFMVFDDLHGEKGNTISDRGANREKGV